MKNVVFSQKFIQHFVWTSLLAVMFAGLSGCAYYNTFYNTKKYYKEALEARKQRKGERISTQERQAFDKTIRQASKVLQLFPESKYIDDSLFITGECFFYQENYLKAERKFQELLTLFPKSEYAPRARLWLAKTQVQLSKYDEAEVGLRTIVDDGKNGKLRDDAQFWLGESYLQQNKLDAATTAYRNAAKRANDNDLKTRSYMRLGEIYTGLEKPELAAEAYSLASRRTENIDLRFNASLEFGRALSSAKKHDEAIRVFSNLIEKEFNNPEVGLAKLELGKTLQAVNDTASAFEWYRTIIEDHPRTNGAVGAYIELGRFEELENGNYKAAEDFYKKAKLQSGKSDYLQEANQRLAAVTELISIQDEVAELMQGIVEIEKKAAGITDSTATVKGEADMLGEEAALLKNRASGATNSRRSATTRKRPAAKKANRFAERFKIEDVDSLKTVLAGKKIALAEVLMLQYAQTDSAINQYLDVLSSVSTHKQRALAFYALSYIFDAFDQQATMRDSIYQILVTNYRNTPQGAEAARALGLQVEDDQPPVINAAAESDFRTATALIIEENSTPEGARKLEDWLQRYEAPELKPHALYALGWAYENRLNSPERAYETYKALTTDFPDSPYADNVRKKVKWVEDERKRAEQSAAAASDSTANAPAVPGEKDAPAKTEPAKKENQN